MFTLRWRFDYSDRPQPITGQWSRFPDPNHLKEMAAFQPRTNLIRASVEGKDVVTKEVVTLAEVDGWDLVNFEWIGEARKGRFSDRVSQKIRGLRIITRDKIISCWDNRKEPTIEDRPEEDLNFNYATFGK